MIPVIERELVDKKEWVKPTDFYHMISIAQAIPGIIAINSAIYLGYKLKGVKGACVSALGVILPSFLIILMVAFTYIQIGVFPAWLMAFFEGVRVAVVGLILVAGYKLYQNTDNPYKIVIAGLAFALITFTTVHPFFLIIGVGVLTLVFTKKARDHVTD